MYGYDMPVMTYPSGYHDPDTAEAENLTAAAWYLIEAGRSADAQPLIDTVIECFKDVPFDKKRKIPSKHIGKVTWIPSGILSLAIAGFRTLDVPAPKYDPEHTEKDEKQAAVKRLKAICKDAGMLWFPGRQAVAAMQHGLPSTTSFRPAVMLSSINAICRNAKPRIPEEASSVLGDKLMKILNRNLLREDACTALKNDLLIAAASRNQWYADPEGPYGFAWMDEKQVKASMRILETYDPNAYIQMQKIPFHVVKWDHVPCHTHGPMMAVLEKPSSADFNSYPFINTFLKAKDRDGYYESEEIKLRNAIWDACQAAIDVSNLQRCHAALCREKDEYLSEILEACQMTDPELDDVLPADLYRQAALCIMGRAWKTVTDKDKTSQAFDVMERILNTASVREALDSPLLHPEPKPVTEKQNKTA